MKSQSSFASRKGKGTSRRPPTYERDILSPDEGDEDYAAQMDALTTSRLIEQDNTLDDSWKNSPQKPGGVSLVSDAQTPNEGKHDNGVFGLLVQYSKAHTGGKGPKIG